MKSLSLASIRAEFTTQMDLARSLVNVGEGTISGADLGMSRETRGLAMVILFAAYEKLLGSLAREILETTSTYRGHRRNLVPGLKLLSISGALQSVQGATKKNLWSTCGPKLSDQLASPAGTLDPSIFPGDGSFMNESQVVLFCEIFAVSDWRKALGKSFALLSEIRDGRNAVAHGRMTAEEVGRRTTYGDTLTKIDEWEAGWKRFLDQVEALAAHRSYFIAS